ncbi:MAG: histidine ammonia-lyase [Bacteriovoracaceae bacterium]|nr:histidine ammonia-lyase [Bacteriovoracaceae bacterium]
MQPIILKGNNLSLATIHQVAYHHGPLHLQLDPACIKRIAFARQFVLRLAQGAEPVYGINTGIGSMAAQKIDLADLEQLQYNIVRSHCAGVGNYLSREQVRAIMLLRANCLAQGNSGVDPSIIDLILAFLHFEITPRIPEKGSVGASGDLAPLAALALALIGEGEVEFQGKIMPAQAAMEKCKLVPARLGPKDGLALINGTTAMTALGTDALWFSDQIIEAADIIGALTADSLRASCVPFSAAVQQVKPHPGQQQAAAHLFTLLQGSSIMEEHTYCNKVQDPYSIRCMPQVHGAARQALGHAKEVLLTEINAVTDNPLVFPEENKVCTGGNFHGAAIALAYDYLAMGLTMLGSISERRMEKLLDPTFSEQNLFLAHEPHLESGLMVAHVTAAALVNENKILAHPACTDSISTSANIEDHVSMGMNAARKLLAIVDNTATILAIELLGATTALDGRPGKTSPALTKIYQLVRQKVAPLAQDRSWQQDIAHVKTLVKEGHLGKALLQD